MTQYKLELHHQSFPADTISAMNIFAKLREESPYNTFWEQRYPLAPEPTLCCIGTMPIAEIKVQNGQLLQVWPDGERQESNIMEAALRLTDFVQAFFEAFHFSDSLPIELANLPCSGLWGYKGYDAAKYSLPQYFIEEYPSDIPELWYQVYRYWLVFDYNMERLHVLEWIPEGEQSKMEREIIAHLESPKPTLRYFQVQSEPRSDISDLDFNYLLEQYQLAIQNGQVLDLSAARHYQQKYLGDSLQLYRAWLRETDAAYYFYSDYDDFQLLGSSHQPIYSSNSGLIEASIPVASTSRSSYFQRDTMQLQAIASGAGVQQQHLLQLDAFHNQLCAISADAKVVAYQEIQPTERRVSLCSVVQAQQGTVSPMRVLDQLWLSDLATGIPQDAAVELLNHFESSNRNFYGGCIGYCTWQGNQKQFGMFDFVLAKNQQLHYFNNIPLPTNQAEQDHLIGIQQDYWELLFKAANKL